MRQWERSVPISISISARASAVHTPQVLDEAHHAHGQHPYAQILEQYVDHGAPGAPRLLGESAMPAGETSVVRAVRAVQWPVRMCRCQGRAPRHSSSPMHTARLQPMRG